MYSSSRPQPPDAAPLSPTTSDCIGSEAHSELSSSTSPYRRDRYDRLTRREFLNRKTLHHQQHQHRGPTTVKRQASEEKKVDDHDLLMNYQQNKRSTNDDYLSRKVVTLHNGPEEAVELDLKPSGSGDSLSQKYTRTKRLLRKRDLVAGKQFHTGTVATDTTADSSMATLDHHHPQGYTSLNGADEFPRYHSFHEKLQENEKDDGDSDSGGYSTTAKPQHYATTTTATTTDNHIIAASTDTRYYRIIYRGVVALLTGPEASAPRSGNYLGYGEIFCSTLKLPVDGDGTVGPTLTIRTVEENEADPYQYPAGILDSPPRSIVSQHTNGSVSSLDTFQTKSTLSHAAGPYGPQGDGNPTPLSPTLSHASTAIEEHRSNLETKTASSHNDNVVIRVDRVLTGGYAMDGLGRSKKGITNSIAEDAETPRRSNLDYYIPIAGPTEEGIDLIHQSPGALGLGFLFLHRDDVQIVEAIDHKPQLEEGSFQYRVVSPTPLPIYAGPSFDAPKIKAMALPGTTHEVSLKICVDGPEETSMNAGVWFLRLNHRRGWVADRKKARKHSSSTRWVTVMREVFNGDDGSSIADDVSAVSSVASSSAMTPTAAGARRRHRPPRKRRDAAKDTLPAINSGMSTPVKLKPRTVEHHAMTPSSNISILSDDSSVDRSSIARNGSVPTSPDYSLTSNATSNVSNLTTQISNYYLMRVTAPRGLKILDAPHFQVNNLIRGKGAVAPSHAMSQLETSSSDSHSKSHHSIFHTMSTRLGTSKSGNPAVFDKNSKTRILPRGAIFEASKRMEASGVYSQGAGLIKLSDGSGWAVVPRKDELDLQYRAYHGRVGGRTDGEVCSAFEEVGHAVVESAPILSMDSTASRSNESKWIRIASRTGILVSCTPSLPFIPDDETSPSSRGSSAISFSNNGSSVGAIASQDSDVASSVASTFVDTMMFRTPKKKGVADTAPATNDTTPGQSQAEKHRSSYTIPCGMCVEVEKYNSDSKFTEYARLFGGQGWVPLVAGSKEVSTEVMRPDFRFGSFWFRVQAARGIKVRLGPSKRAPSIKSEDGVHFRFECGEFLRASEIMTLFSKSGQAVECFAKLYRNRHAQLHHGHEDYRSFQSLTVQAEWVQVFSEEELILEECAAEPRIERHKQGWRYNVVGSKEICVRKGPSFSAETTGSKLLGGESVVVNERVTPAGDKITWLRMKDGDGWLHDVDDQGKQVMLAHSLRHRAKSAAAAKPPKGPKEEDAYNTIIARLFQNDAPKEGIRTHKLTRSKS